MQFLVFTWQNKTRLKVLSICTQDSILLRHISRKEYWNTCAVLTVQKNIMESIILKWKFETEFETLPKSAQECPGPHTGVKFYHSTHWWHETHSRSNALKLNISGQSDRFGRQEWKNIPLFRHAKTCSMRLKKTIFNCCQWCFNKYYKYLWYFKLYFSRQLKNCAKMCSYFNKYIWL